MALLKFVRALLLVVVVRCAARAFGRKQGEATVLRDEALTKGASVEVTARHVIEANKKRRAHKPPDSHYEWLTSRKTGESIEGLVLADGRRVFTTTFQTEKTAGPGFCWCIASMLAFGLTPHILWWHKPYSGMITKIYAFNQFFDEFDFKPDDVIVFVDGRDSVFIRPVQEMVDRFDKTGRNFFWGADGGCIPGFCDYERMDQYPEAHFAQHPKFKYLNSGTFIGKAGFAREYFKVVEPLFEELATDIDQGGISIAYIDARIPDSSAAKRKFKTVNEKHRVEIDTRADFFVSGWFVPVRVIDVARASVIHFNGGFNVGADQDKQGDLNGLMMRVSESFYIPTFHALQEHVSTQPVTMQGKKGKGVPFNEVCGSCLTKVHELDSDMLHAFCTIHKENQNPGKKKDIKMVLSDENAEHKVEQKYRSWLKPYDH